MLATLINMPCSIVRRAAGSETDDYGNAISVPTEVDTVCEVQQRRRDELADGEVSEGDWLGIFPAGTALDTSDAVIVDGLGEFELIGDPWPARNPRTQSESHVEATLRRVAGAGAGS